MQFGRCIIVLSVCMQLHASLLTIFNYAPQLTTLPHDLQATIAQQIIEDKVSAFVAVGAPASTTLDMLDPVRSVAWHPHKSILATGDADGTLTLWDTFLKRKIRSIDAHKGRVHTIAWSTDGTHLASGGEDGKLIIFDTTSWKTVITYEQDGAITAVSWKPKALVCAASSIDGTLAVYDTKTKLLAQRSTSGAIYSVAWHPQQPLIAAGSSGYAVTVYTADTLTPKDTYTDHTGPVLAVCWSADGTRIASASHDTTISIRRYDDLKQKPVRLTGHLKAVSSLAWHPTLPLLASGSWDTTTLVWNVKTGTVITKFEGHTGFVNSVAFDTRGTTLASGSTDRTVKLWNTQPLVTSDELAALTIEQALFIALLHTKRPTQAHAKVKPIALATLDPRLPLAEAQSVFYSFTDELQARLKNYFAITDLTIDEQRRAQEEARLKKQYQEEQKALKKRLEQRSESPTKNRWTKDDRFDLAL